MRRATIRIAMAVALVGLGWVAGRAQPAQPDFELVVTTAGAETSVQCVRGCELAWVERGVNPRALPQPSFSFACGGATRCESGKIGGWVGH